MNRKQTVLAIAIVVIVVVGGYAAYASLTGGSSSGKVQLTETGSSLLYPVFNKWAPDYKNATITTASTGSGTGISQAEAGKVNIGASDAYIQGTVPSGVENIPILISYQYICYNVPGVSTGLNLSANIIAGIYMGTITNWNSSLIQAANPHATLPNHSIVPVHRSDGSGDTFMFTSFLAHGNATWGSKYHFGTSASIFPAVSGELTGAQNTGIINAVNATRYSIGYIAATYQTEINNDHFGIANLENKAGFFVAPTVANVKAAASGYLSSIPSNGSIALQYAPGNNSYPIADMEYVVVQLHQSSTSVANALKDFLTWVLSPSGGSQTKYLSAMNLVALPSNVVASVSQPMINKITG